MTSRSRPRCSCGRPVEGVAGDMSTCGASVCVAARIWRRVAMVQTRAGAKARCLASALKLEAIAMGPRNVRGMA